MAAVMATATAAALAGVLAATWSVAAIAAVLASAATAGRGVAR